MNKGGCLLLYFIKANDFLHGISVRFRISIQEILKAIGALSQQFPLRDID